MIEGETAVTAAVINSLEQEIKRKYIRSPVDGHIGEIIQIPIGAFIEEGDRLGSIAAAGNLRIVAWFSPGAFGRIQPGQQARMRLEGFPWIQYGSVTATVTHIASEVRDGEMRVELNLDTTENSLIPFQHGLSGSVEVAVEYITPVTLLLRTVGQLRTSL